MNMLQNVLILKVNMLWEYQSAGGDELSVLMPSVLRPSGGAFIGKL